MEFEATDEQSESTIGGPGIKRLESERRRLNTIRGVARRTYRTVVFTAVAGAFTGPVLAYVDHLHGSVLVVVLFYSVLPSAAIPLVAMRLRDVENDIQEVDFQLDLFSYEATEREMRAEKLLRLNDIQLRRYYDLNLTQNRWIFGLGVGCIALGGLIIGISLYLVFHMKDASETTKIITATLGAVGAILTNFVAAIYLKMNAATTETLAAFHSRLVETHQLMLGNLLASRIDNDDKRWDTLAALSLRLVPQKEEKAPT